MSKNSKLRLVTSKEFKANSLNQWIQSAINKEKYAEMLQTKSGNVINTSMEISKNNELINKVVVWKKTK